MEREHEKYQRLHRFLQGAAADADGGRASLRRELAARRGRRGAAGADRADPGRSARADRGGREGVRHRHLGACRSSMRRTARRPPRRRCELVREGKAEALMKGSLHTDELMGAVVQRDTGLRTARRVSHCFVMDVPTYAETLIVTDAAVNIAPTMEDKVDIIQNAIDLAHALRFPRCAWRSCRRWRPSIRRCRRRSRPARCARWPTAARSPARILDGPLALDNAISLESVEDQEDRLAGRRARERAGRARSRGRQHAGEEPVVPGRRRCRRHRARRARADHPDQPRRLGDDAARLVRASRRWSRKARREAGTQGAWR